MSPKDRWYLDHGFWANTVYAKWQKMYDYKLPAHRYVLGGETALWSETVDEFSLDVKIWPRAGAVAERLWTDPMTNSISAQKRFENFRNMLTLRGIQSDAVSPYYCYLNDGKCL